MWLCLDLLLECSDAEQPAERGHHAEQGMELRYLGDMGLDEKDAFFRVESCCQPVE